MLRRTINLGILAHVDAGKTTLTERLLFAAGVIDEIGSVDAGTTQTDSLELERRRGITIKSAVVSFAIDDVTVNLIDTPGHPDFIAEVERVLSVLDGAVLVISAVEGVQPQTHLLMRALQRLRLPTLLFVNKVDRAGAAVERVLEEIRRKLTESVVPMESSATDWLQVLADHDDSLLAAYVEDEWSVPDARLRAELANQTKRALVHPVFSGSALKGVGVDRLMTGIAGLLPAADGKTDDPASGTVFKVERAPSGEKIAYVRMFSGSVRVREKLRFGRDFERKVTAIGVFDHGGVARRASVSAGEIAKLSGLAEIQVGDVIGDPHDGEEHRFAPPTLETVVVPRDPDGKGALRVALARLAEQDPLIDVRQDDERGEISVSLYGEVQKEVIQATLADDFGLDVGFRETTTICIERPVGMGHAVETLQEETNPFLATVGLRVEPAPIGSGVRFRLEVDPRSVPLYIYKTADGFAEFIAQRVRTTLREGLCGWQVTDCTVRMTDCGYYVGDGPGKRAGAGGEIHLHGSRTTGADFGRLAPLVLMRALEQAGTVICEPMADVRVEIPVDAVGATQAALGRLGATGQTPSLQDHFCVLESSLPAGRVNELQRQLPRLTGGEGVLETSFGGYQPVGGPAPVRRRTTPNPLDRTGYLLHLSRRVSSR